MVCETIRGTEQIDLPPRPTFIYRFFNSGDMARRSRVPPMELRLDFQFPEGSMAGFIDVGQCLGLLNRKGLRQGQQYFVESWSISGNVSANTQLLYLSNTWVCSNAWVKAFRTWMKSQEQLEDFDDIKGRYHDFKVKFTEGQVFANNLLPFGIDFAAAAAISPTISANWAPSHIQIPNDGAVGVTNEYDIHMLGPNTGASKGAITGYANSRARPMQDDPNIVNASSWMDFAFDDGDNLAEIRSDVVTENDSPPYIIDAGETAFEFYPGGSNFGNGAGSGMQHSALLSINPALSSFSSRFGQGFLANCGLIAISGRVDAPAEGADPSLVTLTLNIAAGPSKGVMARPMQDVN